MKLLHRSPAAAGPALALAVVLAGCGAAITGGGPAAPGAAGTPEAAEPVDAHELARRELVVRELHAAQARLDDLAFDLLAAAVPFCQGRAVPRTGVTLATVHGFDESWQPAARAALQLGDTLAVVGVAANSPADAIGLATGDRILFLNSEEVPLGQDAETFAADFLAWNGDAGIRLTVLRGSEIFNATLTPVRACALSTTVTADGGLTLLADGAGVVVPWAMMHFADDVELQSLVGHELAHHALGHHEARAFGQGEAFPEPREREADYVATYVLARAGAPLAALPDVWRQLTQISPAAIPYAVAHPTTPERFASLRQVIREIEEKRAGGATLLPDAGPGSVRR